MYPNVVENSGYQNFIPIWVSFKEMNYSFYPNDGLIQSSVLPLVKFWCHGFLERFQLPPSLGCYYVSFYALILALISPLICYPLIWCILRKKSCNHIIAPWVSLFFEICYLYADVAARPILFIQQLMTGYWYVAGKWFDEILFRHLIQSLIIDLIIMFIYFCISRCCSRKSKKSLE